MPTTRLWEHPTFLDLYAQPLSPSRFEDLDSGPRGSSGPRTLIHQASGLLSKASKALATVAKKTPLSAIAFANASQTSALGSMGSDGSGERAATLDSLATGLSFVAEFLPPGEYAAATVLREAASQASAMVHLASREAGKTGEAADASRLVHVVEVVTHKVKELGSGRGGACCIPVGWRRSSEVSELLLLVVSRAAGADEYEVSVASAGPGTQYHAARADPATGGLQLQLPMRLRQVAASRVCNPTFWFVVLRPLVWEAEEPASHGPAPLYEQLLPWLNGRPPLANGAERADEANDGADDGAATLLADGAFDSEGSWCSPPARATAAGCGHLAMQASEASSNLRLAFDWPSIGFPLTFHDLRCRRSRVSGEAWD